MTDTPRPDISAESPESILSFFATGTDLRRAVDEFGWPSAAAVGCLLALVRKAISEWCYAAPLATIDREPGVTCIKSGSEFIERSTGGGWAVFDEHGAIHGVGRNEHEALLVALKST